MGLDIGLERAGIDVLLASEINKACCETIRINKPSIALIGDIRDYTAAQIRHKAGLNANEAVDLMVGGPPCQAFSTAGRRLGFEDERGNVFLKFIDLITEISPKFAVIENVRGLLSAPLSHRPHNMRGSSYPQLTPIEQRGGALLHVIRTLRDHGYAVSFNLYNAANFGTAQKRERVVIICSSNGIKAPFLTPSHSETGAHGLPPWRTFREAVLGLREEAQDFIPFPESRLKYYRLLSAGQHWRHLPAELQKEALGKSYYAGGGKTGFLRRLAWDKPAPTLVTHPAMPATDLAHPTENRPLSIQEYIRLQDFPDDWDVRGSLVDKYRQIGNAVPCRLGEAIGQRLIALIMEQQTPIFPGFRYSRYHNTDDMSWEDDILQSELLVPQLPLDEADIATV